MSECELVRVSERVRESECERVQVSVSARVSASE